MAACLNGRIYCFRVKLAASAAAMGSGDGFDPSGQRPAKRPRLDLCAAPPCGGEGRPREGIEADYVSTAHAKNEADPEPALKAAGGLAWIAPGPAGNVAAYIAAFYAAEGWLQVPPPAPPPPSAAATVAAAGAFATLSGLSSDWEFSTRAIPGAKVGHQYPAVRSSDLTRGCNASAGDVKSKLWT